MTWRLARSLEQLRSEVDASWPSRSTASDGSIGDAAHQSRDSDHNPWVRDGQIGVVTAVDITDDRVAGVQIADEIVRVLVAARDPRMKYLIHDGRIWRAYDKPGIPAWTPAHYSGPNPHTHHVHVSVQPDKKLYDAPVSWGIQEATMTTTPTKRRWRVVARTATGAVVLVRRLPGGTFTYRRQGSVWMTRAEAKNARAWAGRRRARETWLAHKGQPTHLRMQPGATLPSNPRLVAAVNKIGVAMHREIRGVSGQRTAYEAWQLYQAYLRGQGNLAAKCCNRGDWHTWEQCGKQPHSMHARGEAIDCGVISRTGRYTSLGKVKRAARLAEQHGLRFAVGIDREPWHLELA